MNLVLPFERQMALAFGCLPLQQQPPPSAPLSPLLLHVCHLPLPLPPLFLLQGIFMNACRKNAYLCSTLFRASPIYTLPLAALLRMYIYICIHLHIMAHIYAHYIRPYSTHIRNFKLVLRANL